MVESVLGYDSEWWKWKRGSLNETLPFRYVRSLGRATHATTTPRSHHAY